jgi:hypothetical protein
MDQRLSPCAHRAPRLPVPSTTTSTTQGSLYTAPWPHHPDGTYRPFLPGMAMSDYRQTDSAGYFCSPYSAPPTFSQLGITSPGHVTRWWVQEGHDRISPLWANMSYTMYPWSGPTPCGSDSETQDDRFSLPQSRERQMLAIRMRHMTALGESQAPISGESRAPISGES